MKTFNYKLQFYSFIGIFLCLIIALCSCQKERITKSEIEGDWFNNGTIDLPVTPQPISFIDGVCYKSGDKAFDYTIIGFDHKIKCKTINGHKYYMYIDKLQNDTLLIHYSVDSHLQWILTRK